MKQTSLFSILMTALMAVTFLATAAGQSHAAQKEGIAVVVNDSIVSYSDVRARMKLNMVAGGLPDTPEVQQKLQSQVLNGLIDEALQMAEAQKLDIKITDAQIDDGFANIAQKNGMTTEKFEQAMKNNGVPIYTLRDQLEAQIAWSQVVRRVLRPKVNISENEIEAVLDEQERDAGKPEFHVAEIFLEVKTPEQEQQVEVKAAEVLKILLNGAPFSQVAHQYSQSSGAARGGDLGWVKAGQLEPELDRAVHVLDPGQVSPPVRSATGYHILYLRDKRQNNAMPSVAHTPKPAQVSAEVNTPKTTMVHMKQIFIPVETTEPQPVVSAKLARAKQLGGEITDCEMMSKKSQDFTSPATGDLGRVALESLPDSVVETVKSLPIGKLSAPLTNAKGIFVLMVCDREEPAQRTQTAAEAEVEKYKQSQQGYGQNQTPTSSPSQNLRDDQAYRERIANELGMERLDGLQQRYLQDLRATAYIDRRI